MDENPDADILFHPTGRKINARPPYAVDMAALIRAAKRRVRLICSRVSHYAFLRWGIGQARRGWAEKKDVVNTRPWRQMLKLLK